MVYIFIFTLNHFRRRTKRERERESTPALAPPSRSSPSKTDPPKTDLIGADVTDLVLVLDPKLISVADLVVLISSHR